MTDRVDTKPSKDFQLVDESFIDDETNDSTHSHSSSEDEELLQDYISDSE